MTVERLHEVLAAAGVDLTGRELAEILWLAARVGPPPAGAPGEDVPADAEPFDPPGGTGSPQPTGRTPEPTRPERVPLHIDDDEPDGVPARPVRVRAARALSGPQAVQRALRPLKRRVPSTRDLRLDEEATARRIAETGIRLPVLVPAPARWLDLVLVADVGAAEQLWLNLARELHLLFRHLGGFRDVRLRYLHGTDGGALGLSATHQADDARTQSPTSVIDPTGRQLVLVLSDCVGAAWRDGTVGDVLARWAATGPTAILQPLPERLWSRTAAPPVRGRLHAPAPGTANTRLTFTGYQRRWRSLPPDAVAVPVLELGPDWLAPWARLVAGQGAADLSVLPAGVPGPMLVEEPPADLGPVERVARFRAEASATAYELAGYLAAAPLSLSVVRLIQEVMLPESRPAHLAELMFSGLLRAESPAAGGDRLYDFAPGVRDLLLGTLSRNEVDRVRDRVSLRVERDLHRAGPAFTVLAADDDGTARLPAGSRSFARVEAQIRRRVHGVPAAVVTTAPAEVALGDLADVLRWAEETSDVDDVTEAVARVRHRVEGTPPASPAHWFALGYLARLHLVLARRFGRTDALTDVESICRTVIAEGPAEARAGALATLSEAFEEEVMAGENRHSMDEVIATARAAVKAEADGAGLVAARARLGRLLAFDSLTHPPLARPEDVDEAIELLREPARRATADDRYSLATVQDLARALTVRGARRAALSDLDEAIELWDRTLDWFVPGRRQSGYLCVALGERHRLTGDAGDLDRALAVYDMIDRPEEQAVLRGLLVGLLRRRFAVLGDPADLDRAVTAAWSSTRDDAEVPASWELLADVLAERAELPSAGTETPSESGETGGDDRSQAVAAQLRAVGLLAGTGLWREYAGSLARLAAFQGRAGRWADALGSQSSAVEVLRDARAERYWNDAGLLAEALLTLAWAGRSAEDGATAWRAQAEAEQLLTLSTSDSGVEEATRVRLLVELAKFRLAAPGFDEPGPSVDLAEDLARARLVADPGSESLLDLARVLTTKARILLSPSAPDVGYVADILREARGLCGRAVGYAVAPVLEEIRSVEEEAAFAEAQHDAAGRLVVTGDPATGRHLPDAARSQVVMIGPDIQGSLRAAVQVREALSALSDQLTGSGGVFAADSVLRLGDNDPTLEQDLRRAASRATDTFFVYYAGEVSFDTRSALRRPSGRSLNFHALRRLLAESPAHRRVLIVDHCMGAPWTGRTPDARFLEGADPPGPGYQALLVALSGDAAASPSGFPLTERMTALLSEGVPGAGPVVLVSELARCLAPDLRRRGLAFGWSASSEEWDLALAHNAAYHRR
ncbi:SAV_2336 N-terminal domain-related protein [Longispora urticae]